MSAKYTVNLTQEEHRQLVDLLKKGKNSARVLKRSQILLLADQGYQDGAIASMLIVGESTVHRARQRYVEILLPSPKIGRGAGGEGKTRTVRRIQLQLTRIRTYALRSSNPLKKGALEVPPFLRGARGDLGFRLQASVRKSYIIYKEGDPTFPFNMSPFYFDIAPTKHFATRLCGLKAALSYYLVALLLVILDQGDCLPQHSAIVQHW